jgi:RecA/RadA recombinase
MPASADQGAAMGIQTIDELLEGGFPLGAITEIVGLESSGRISFALSFLAQMTQAEKVCAWIDVSDTLDPESTAAAGVNLSRLLWVRCGVQTIAFYASGACRVAALRDARPRPVYNGGTLATSGR